MNLTQSNKDSLLKLARESINSIYEENEVDLTSYSQFNTPLGVFVTLYLNDNLRGCIGYSKPYYPLCEGILKAAQSAAFEDRRFEPVTKEEFEKVKIEISILTTPNIINVLDYKGYLEKIELGTDGLIIQYGPNEALFLPQVPLELGWDINEYLGNLCNKAGIGFDEWKEPGVKIYKFQSIIMCEK